MNLIISGSITSGYGLLPETPRWYQIMQNNLSGIDFEIRTKDGMNFDDASKVINQVRKEGDILILYFGTRIGWPKISKTISAVLPFLKKNSGYLDLSIKEKESEVHKFHKVIKNCRRNSIKFIGILFRQYKPVIPLSKSIVDLRNLLLESESKYKTIIYIQHHHFFSNRLRYETRRYEKIYHGLLQSAESLDLANLYVIEFPRDLLRADFFLPDCVHFSKMGHHTFGKFMAQKIISLSK